jgi:hypothetical protein
MPGTSSEGTKFQPSLKKTALGLSLESEDNEHNRDKEVVFSEKVTYLTFGDYPAISGGPIQDLVFAPDQEGILLTVHGPGQC